MNQRPLHFFTFAAAIFAVGGPSFAVEGAKEAAAARALKAAKADERAHKYARGVSALEKARDGCGDDECSSGTKASVLRELGALEFESGDRDAAQKSFSDARAIDPALPFDHNDDADLVALWNQAGSKAADSSESSESEPSTPSEKSEEPSDESGEGTQPTPEAAPVPSAGEPAPFARFWIGVGGSLDFVELPNGSDLCLLGANDQPVNASHAVCTNPNGTDFPSRSNPAENAALVPGQAGRFGGGLSPGDVRVYVAVDYAATPNVLAGARVGYVTNTYPGTAAFDGKSPLTRNVHAELRGTYVFGDRPLSRVGFAPQAFAGFGASEFDGHGVVLVETAHIAGARPVDLWTVTGPWFFVLGGGARYQFSPRTAFTLAVRANLAFGRVFLLTAGPELSFQYGF